MGKFSASVTLNRSVQEIFAFLNDQQNFVGLNEHNFRNYRVVSPESVGVGVQAEFVLKTGSFQEPVQLQVISSQPPTLVVQEGHISDNAFRTTWKLNSLSSLQTELELTTEYEVSGLATLFGAKIQAAFVRIYKRLLTDMVHKLNSPT